MTPGNRRRARVLVTKVGLDGHDRGSRIVAAYLRDAGMEVIYTAPWQTIAGVVKLAVEEDVDVVGVSSLATDHLLLPRLVAGLREAGMGHVREMPSTCLGGWAVRPWDWRREPANPGSAICGRSRDCRWASFCASASVRRRPWI